MATKDTLTSDDWIKAAFRALTAGGVQAIRAEAIARVRSLMAEYGLTLADLGAKAAPAARKPGGGAKVPPKYRNAATGDTWSGRGLQPNWLKAALASGRKLDDFKV